MNQTINYADIHRPLQNKMVHKSKHGCYIHLCTRAVDSSPPFFVPMTGEPNECNNDVLFCLYNINPIIHFAE